MRSNQDGTRKPADRALTKTEARLRPLYDALWVSPARDGHLIYANQHFHDYLGDIGPARQARTGAHHPDDAGRAGRAWAASIATGVNCAFEARWRRRDGTYRWHKFLIVPIRRRG